MNRFILEIINEADGIVLIEFYMDIVVRGSLGLQEQK